jgi:predicted DNA binding CopG/RHH family protein
MKGRKVKKLKKLPLFKSDAEAEHFVATADLTDYDLSAMTPVRFEFKPKTERVNMRLSKELLKSVKARAAKQGVSYQRYIRLTLERAVAAQKI